jgi:hypothetical protein
MAASIIAEIAGGRSVISGRLQRSEAITLFIAFPFSDRLVLVP